jgi:SAM-dependent methyltransferase
MIKGLKSIYQQQMFFPGLIGIFVNPFFLARSGLKDAITELAPMLTGRLLDVGCGSKPYEALFAVDAYIGLDIDSVISRQRGMADYYYDGNIFPFADDSFDSVLCNQVLEHVFNPNEFLAEISRVLKPGGKLLLTVPFVWDEHEQPYDYARYSSFGLHALIYKQGFKIVHHKKIGADASIIFQLTNAYLFKVTQSWSIPSKLLLTASVMALLNAIGLLVRRILPDNPDFFLDHIVLAETT